MAIAHVTRKGGHLFCRGRTKVSCKHYDNLLFLYFMAQLRLALRLYLMHFGT